MKKALHWSAFCFGCQLSLCLLSETSKKLGLYVCYAAITAVHFCMSEYRLLLDSGHPSTTAFDPHSLPVDNGQ